MSDFIYRNHDPLDVVRSPEYRRHMMQMTGENLREKAEIAEELAVRDLRIAQLEAELAEAREALTNINALGPHHNHIGQVSDNAMRGLVIRMSEISAVALARQGGEG